MYQASVAPAGAACDGRGCFNAARVRLARPAACETVSGHPGGTAHEDVCDFCWTRRRDEIAWADTTGSVADLRHEFPFWNIWQSNGGRLYASTRLDGHGLTLHGLLAGDVRAQILAVTDRLVSHG